MYIYIINLLHTFVATTYNTLVIGIHIWIIIIDYIVANILLLCLKGPPGVVINSCHLQVNIIIIEIIMSLFFIYISYDCTAQ